jgi:glycosyltransferase involved in cell wall biosynthesis
VIYDKHEDYSARSGIPGRAIRAIERWAYRWVAHVILAEESYQDAIEGSNADSTVILNYALPVESPPAGRSSGAAGIRLAYTGTVSEGRGLFHMLELGRLANERGLRVLIEIAGICNHPGQRRDAERFIREHGLTETVVLYGWDHYASAGDIHSVMAGADLGLMLADPVPNYAVSIPTKFYEYLQHGLPMLVSDLPLWRAFVQDNGCGLTVQPADPDAILDTIVDLVNSSRITELQTAAKREAHRFEWGVMERRLLDLYATLGGGPQ